MIFLDRFVRKGGKPDEDYLYRVLSDAIKHFELFFGDNSDMHKMILLFEWEGKKTKILDKCQF